MGEIPELWKLRCGKSHRKVSHFFIVESDYLSKCVKLRDEVAEKSSSEIPAWAG